MSRLRDLEETFWERHSNPKSGWSRALTLPVLLYAVYRRNWREAAVAVAFTTLNPILFEPPADDDAWMTRVVLAERWWTTDTSHGLFDCTYPNVLNLLNVPTTLYAFIAAYRQQPRRTACAGLASIALKFWYVAALVRRYERAIPDDSETGRTGTDARNG